MALCVACRSALPRMRDPSCAICGISLTSEDGTCLSCRAFGTALPGIRLLRSAFLYAGSGPELLHAYKAEGGRLIARFWAQALDPLIRQIWEPGMAIVAVPALSKNRRRRGFDQVTLVINALSNEFRIAASQNLLLRSAGIAQKTLSREARQSNLAGAIRVRSGARVPSRILLLDDVCTTGASLSLCAAILRQNGCSDLCAITVFRD